MALVGLFGLRPAELAVLRVEEGRLYVGSVKLNARTLKVAKPERRVLPLDLPGREGEGTRIVALFGSGLVPLPGAIQSQVVAGSYKGVGDAFRQLLDRFPFWQSMVATTPGLTPYSLRHGYAWRGHKGYARSIPVRDLAALMGHNPATHHRHYGKWTDEAGLEEAVAKAVGPTLAGHSNSYQYGHPSDGAPIAQRTVPAPPVDGSGRSPASPARAAAPANRPRNCAVGRSR